MSNETGHQSNQSQGGDEEIVQIPTRQTPLSRSKKKKEFVIFCFRHDYFENASWYTNLVKTISTDFDKDFDGIQSQKDKI